MEALMRVTVLAALLGFAPASMAGVYLGAGGLISEYEFDNVDSGSGGKAFLGYRGDEVPVFFEASYLDFGGAAIAPSTGLELGFGGYNLGLGYRAALSESGSGVWFKIGYFDGDAEISNAGGKAELSSNGFSYGLGADWMFLPNVGLRFELEGLQGVKDFQTATSESNITLASLGLVIALPSRSSSATAAAPVSTPPPPAAPPATSAPPPVLQTQPAVPPEPVVAAAPAAAATAAPAGPRKGLYGVARPGAVIRSQPTPNGPVELVLAGGGEVELVSRMPAVSGAWWFVKSAGVSGWIKQDEMLSVGQ